MIINHNIPALVTNNALGKANTKTDKSSKRLSTGLRINSAADDAAGLAISNKMKTQVKGLKMADRNCNDAISLIQTAEGGLSEVQNMLQRMRELAIQGANDTLTTSDRQKIQDECDQLIDEIADTSKKVQFNTKTLIDGKYDTFTFQVGPNSGLTLTVDMEEITPYKIGAITDEKSTFTSISQLKSEPTSAVKMGIETDIPEIIDSNGNTINRIKFAELNAAKTKVTEKTYNMGSATTPEDSKITETGVYLYKDGKLWDADGNDVSKKFIVYSVPGDKNSANIGFDAANPGDNVGDPSLITVTSTTNEAGATIYKQTVTTLEDPNVDPNLTNPEDVAKDPMTYTLSTDNNETVLKRMSDDGKKLLISDRSKKGGFTTIESCAYTALIVCDGAINDVSELRSRLGAIQNRLEYTSSSLGVASENAETSLSRVQDTDMAAEMTEFTKNNVIVQAGIAMLSQANQRPNQLLSLLQ